MIFHSSAPLHCRSALYSLAKRPVIFINRTFFLARLRLKNSAVVARWSHNLKVRGSNPGISSNFTILMIFPNFLPWRILIFSYLGSLGCPLWVLKGPLLGTWHFIQIYLAMVCSGGRQQAPGVTQSKLTKFSVFRYWASVCQRYIQVESQSKCCWDSSQGMHSGWR